MYNVAFINIILFDCFVFDKLDLRPLVFLLGIFEPVDSSNHCRYIGGRFTYVGPMRRLMLACVSWRRLAASSVLK